MIQTRGGNVDWAPGKPEAETRGGLTPQDWKVSVGAGDGDDVGVGVGGGAGSGDTDGEIVGVAGGGAEDEYAVRDSVVQPGGEG